MPYANSPLITVKRNVYAVKLNDEVVYRPCMEGTKRYRTFSNRVISSGCVNLKTYIRMTGVTSYNNIVLVCGRFGLWPFWMYTLQGLSMFSVSL